MLHPAQQQELLSAQHNLISSTLYVSQPEFREESDAFKYYRLYQCNRFLRSLGSFGLFTPYVFASALLLILKQSPHSYFFAWLIWTALNKIPFIVFSVYFHFNTYMLRFYEHRPLVRLDYTISTIASISDFAANICGFIWIIETPSSTFAAMIAVQSLIVHSVWSSSILYLIGPTLFTMWYRAPDHLTQEVVVESVDPESIFSSCSICITEFKKGEEVLELFSCRHRFHQACYDRLLAPACPNCREAIV